MTTTETEVAAPLASLAVPGRSSPEATEPVCTVVQPASGWQALNVAELWQYRGLIYFLIWRDVKGRYKQTVLGVAWAVLQPAIMMVMFTLLFGRMIQVSSGNVPYPLFAYIGLVALPNCVPQSPMWFCRMTESPRNVRTRHKASPMIVDRMCPTCSFLAMLGWE
jgi:hypothetical protein